MHLVGVWNPVREGLLRNLLEKRLNCPLTLWFLVEGEVLVIVVYLLVKRGEVIFFRIPMKRVRLLLALWYRN